MRLTNKSALRARARKLGYSIHESRLRSISANHLGTYALIEHDSKSVVLGERFDASLEEAYYARRGSWATVFDSPIET